MGVPDLSMDSLSDMASSHQDDSGPLHSGCGAATRQRGLGGVPRIPSLVFQLDLELDDGEGLGSCDDNEHSEGVRFIQRWIMPANSIEYRLISDVETAIRDEPAQATNAELLGQKLTRLGYKVAIRTALGGGGGQDCLKNLRHTFLTCTVPGVDSRKQYVVDPLFKEQFEIAKPSQRYAKLLSALPDVFVGPEENVIPLVTFLSNEMSASFKATGAVLPPWRQVASMLTKWRPRRASEEALDLLPQSCLPLCSQQQHHQLSPPKLLVQQPWPSIAAAAACKTSSSSSHEGNRPLSMEPRRVYFGGNFQAVPSS